MECYYCHKKRHIIIYYKELTKYLESQYTSNSTNIIVEEFGKGGDVLSIMFDENVDEKS